MRGRYNTVHEVHPTFKENIDDLLTRKKKASDARLIKRGADVELPRDVFTGACQDISGKIAPHGFKYAKSGPRCTQRSGDWTFMLLFFSDHYNIAGEHVGFSTTGEVTSKRYKKWSQEIGLANPSNCVVSGQLGYLCNDHLELTWELSNKSVRAGVISGIIRAIEEIALPFFSRFENLEQLCSELQQGLVPMMDVIQAIHFLMCFRNRKEAISVGKFFFKKRPDIVESYRHEYGQIRNREPLRVKGQGWAKELAIVSHFFDLGDLTS